MFCASRLPAWHGEEESCSSAGISALFPKGVDGSAFLARKLIGRTLASLHVSVSVEPGYRDDDAIAFRDALRELQRKGEHFLSCSHDIRVQCVFVARCGNACKVVHALRMILRHVDVHRVRQWCAHLVQNSLSTIP